MISSFVILGKNLLKELVSDEACAAGVVCLFVHYSFLPGYNLSKSETMFNPFQYF